MLKQINQSILVTKNEMTNLKGGKRIEALTTSQLCSVMLKGGVIPKIVGTTDAGKICVEW